MSASSFNVSDDPVGAGNGESSSFNGGDQALLAPVDAVHQIESSGAPDTANPVNPVSGAAGSMQVVPKTGLNPGFGVAPSNGTPEDNARLGRDYYAALQNHYGNDTIAAIAYDWGPGNTNKWLANGAKQSDLPPETRNYANKFLALTGGSAATQPAQPQGATLGFTPISQIPQGPAPVSGVQQFGSGVANAIEHPIDTAVSLAGGAGADFGKSVLGLQTIGGKFLQSLGADDTGQSWIDNAQQGIQNLNQQRAQLPNQTAANVGGFIGGAVPYLVGPEGALPAAAIAGTQSAADTAANGGSGTDIAKSFGVGSLLGAAGSAAGAGAAKLAGGVGAAIQPVIAPSADFVKAAFGDTGAATRMAARNIGGQINTEAAAEGATAGGVQTVWQQGGESIPVSIVPNAAPVTDASGIAHTLVRLPDGSTSYAPSAALGQVAPAPTGIGATIANLRSGSNQIIPGSLPTAAEAADQPVISRIQRGLQNTEPGQAAFPARAAANNAARFNEGFVNVDNNATRTLGQTGTPLAEQEAEFAQQQAQNISRGQTEPATPIGLAQSAPTPPAPGAPASEWQNFINARNAQASGGLPNVTPLQASQFTNSAFPAAIQDAARAASNDGSNAFTSQQATIHQGLRNDIAGIAGTPDTLSHLYAARGDQAAQDFAAVRGVSIPTNDPDFQALQKTDAFPKALKQAQATASDLRQGPILQGATETGANTLSAGDAAVWHGAQGDFPVTFKQIQGSDNTGRAYARVEYNGTTSFVPLDELGRVGSSAKSASGQGLLYAKNALDDAIQRATREGSTNESRGLLSVKNDLVALLEKYAPDYGRARANFAAASEPIDVQQALQKRLVGAVDPLTGEVNASKLRQTINSIQAEQLKPGIRQADRVSPQTLQALTTLGQRAARAETDLTGLNPEGQEYLRQALQNRAQTGGAQAREASQQALDQFNAYLRGASPRYAQAIGPGAQATARDLQSKRALQGLLTNLEQAPNNALGDPQIGYSLAKGAVSRTPGLQGKQAEYAQSLLADLQRSTTPNAALGAAGSQTAANLQLGGGLLGSITQNLGEKAALPLAIRGDFARAALALGAGAVKRKVDSMTDRAAVNLFLNPERLADALEAYKNNPSAGQAFITGLQQKAGKAGKAGAAAVAAYNQWKTQQGAQ